MVIPEYARVADGAAGGRAAAAAQGVPLPAVRRIARDVLAGLDFLHRRCRIVHTDLKARAPPPPPVSKL